MEHLVTSQKGNVMTIVHYLEKGINRAQRLNLESAKSTTICEKHEEGDISAIHECFVNCTACNNKLLQLKIQELNLKQIPNPYEYKDYIYCQNEEGQVFCIKYRSETTRGLFTIDNSGKPMKLIYPR